jgi:DNA-directed RNA polymerase specialized sigma24 family protein
VPQAQERSAAPRRPERAAERLAQVALARRARLLRVHRHRLRPEELEDCYSQATLELLTAIRGGQRFASTAHIANALEQRFLARILDRRRAQGGRSPVQSALEQALPLGGPEGGTGFELADPRAEVHPLVVRRLELARVCEVASELTRDQRLVLASQIAREGDCASFCAAHGWSLEKYRKVAQRGRARLRELLEREPRPAARAAPRFPARSLPRESPAARPGGDDRARSVPLGGAGRIKQARTRL